MANSLKKRWKTYSEIAMYFLCDAIHRLSEAVNKSYTWSVGEIFENCLGWSSFSS